MTLCLITTWFGTFLADDHGITDHLLFPFTPADIEHHLHTIRTDGILAEEHTLAANKKILVNQKRLEPLGTYDPADPVFHTITIDPHDYNASLDLLHQAALHLTRDQATERLHAPDLGIIQMVNALDDLIQTANLLNERFTSWGQLPDTEPKRQPFTHVISAVNQEIERLQTQIDTDMVIIAPNISAIAGPLIGARLIALAGGIDRLAMLPASTIQLLGAEKALFRYKKEGGRPPKHGILFQHPLVNRAPRMERGRRARTLAATLTIAVKADVFTKRAIHAQLTDDLEKKLAGFSKQKR